MRMLAACSLSLLIATVGFSQEPAEPVPAAKLLERKKAEVEKLQAEIHTLSSTTGADRQVMLKLELLEVTRTKPAAKTAQQPAGPKEMSASEVEKFKEAVSKDGTVRVLAEPMLVTVNGRQANMMIGSELPYPDGVVEGVTKLNTRHVGTQFQATPMLTANNRIKLEFCCSVSDVDPHLAVVVQGVTVPGIRRRELNTGIEMPLTKTCVVSGLIQQRNLKEVDPATSEVRTSTVEVETIVLVTASAIEPPDSNQMLANPVGNEAAMWQRHIEVPLPARR